MSEIREVILEFMKDAEKPKDGVPLGTAIRGMLGKQWPVDTFKEHSYEIRDLHVRDNQDIIAGVFAKFRTGGIPHAGIPGGDEHELGLNDGEGLIEKNHFLYICRNEIMLFQRNKHCATHVRFSNYLRIALEREISLEPVLQPEPMKRLMQDGITMKKIMIRLAEPKNPELFRKDDWNAHLLEIMSGAEASSLFLEIHGGRGKKNLSTRMKRALQDLVASDSLESARLDIEENGIVHPIDLLTDRMISMQQVSMLGRYPDPQSIYAKLYSAWIEQKQAVWEIYGEPGDALQ